MSRSKIKTIAAYKHETRKLKGGSISPQAPYGNREAGKEDGWVLRPTRIYYIL